MVKPTPIIYWAQNNNHIFITVDIGNTKDLKIKCLNNFISMTGNGIGAHGLSNYAFSLQLFENIDSDEEEHETNILPLAVELILKKSRQHWWPRLVKQVEIPEWLKMDTRRWTNEEDATDYISEENCFIQNLFSSEKVKRNKLCYVREDIKKLYLSVYNITQFVLFSYVLAIMIRRFMKNGDGAGTYEAVGDVFKFAQLIQFLEIMHPIFGYTKGNLMVPIVHVTRRAIILFVMIEAEPRMQTKPVVFYLFVVWSAIEIFRYSYNITQIYKCKFGLLSWLRYTVFLVLYPLVTVCEGTIIIRNILYFEETQRFVISMPNSWNFTFHMPTAMRLYLLALFLPGTYSLITIMFSARNKKVGHHREKTKIN